MKQQGRSYGKTRPVIRSECRDGAVGVGMGGMIDNLSSAIVCENAIPAARKRADPPFVPKPLSDVAWILCHPKNLSSEKP